MIYDYKCERCDKDFEVEISINEYDKLKDKQFCPECKSKMTRVLSWEGFAVNIGGYSETGGIAKWQTNLK